MEANLRLISIFFRDLRARLTNKPSHLTVFITARCNYRCRMCFYWKEAAKKKKRELKLIEFKKITEKMPKVTSVALTGGEPFLRSDIDKITRLFYDQAGVRSVFIPTNGSLPEIIKTKTESILKKCPQALVTVCLSIDGIEKDHDLIRGIEGAYQKSIKTYQLLKSLQKKHRNLEINCSFTYNKFNQDKLLSTYEVMSQSVGIKNFNASLVRGNTRESLSKDIDIDQYLRAIDQIDKQTFTQKRLSKFGSFFEEIIFARAALTRKLVGQIYKRRQRVLPCLAGTFNLVVAEEGEVYPCEMLNQSFGNLREVNYDLKKLLYSLKAKKIKKFIRNGGCWCTHECNLPDNILFTGKGLVELLRQWWRYRSGDKKTIFFINFFDENYACHVRDRGLAKILGKGGYKVIYSEPGYHWPGAPKISPRDNLVGHLWAAIQRAWQVLTVNYEILFLGQIFFLTAPLIFIAKLRGKKVVLDFDDLASDMQKTQFRSFLCRLSESSIVFKAADMVVGHNWQLLNLAKRRGQKKVFYVPQGIDTDLFNKKRFVRTSLKKKLNLKDKKILVYTASFNTGSVRDLDIILDAMSKIERFQKIVLLILGGGPTWKRFYNLAMERNKKNVRLVGRARNEEIPEYLKIADAGLVFMRDSLGNRMKMSLKTLEYLSMPIPVIGHLVGATKKAVGKYVYEAGTDSSSLARAIIAFFEQREVREPDSRQEIIRNYDWQVVSLNLLEALKNGKIN